MEEKKRPDFEFFLSPRQKKEAPPGASLSHRGVPYTAYGTQYSRGWVRARRRRRRTGGFDVELFHHEENPEEEEENEKNEKTATNQHKSSPPHFSPSPPSLPSLPRGMKGGVVEKEEKGGETMTQGKL